MRDAVATMGAVLPDDVDGRDAVHVAVIAATAGEKLCPSQDVGVSGAQAVSNAKHVGIVDPFIKGAIQKGQRFWLFLYPRTITGLSHRWSHPDFPVDEPAPAPVERAGRQESREWIGNYAAEIGTTGDELIDAATDYIDNHNYFSRGGTFEGMQLKDEFWSHYERVTGRVVKEDDRWSFFSCSC